MISITIKGSETKSATQSERTVSYCLDLSKGHYLYGLKDINMYTDHQPLTFAVLEKHSNAKISR